MCVGGGNLLRFHCLISNTLPQLDPSSLQPPSCTPSSPTATDHLLQPSPTTPHLQKRKTKQKQVKNH